MYLYNILQHTCAKGLALPKVKAFQRTKDGHSAWRALYNHFYAHGNVDSYASSLISQIKALRLTHNSPGGMDKYLSKFEELALELQGKDPLSEAMKRTFLLEGVTDRAYRDIVRICRSSNYDYDKCLYELRRESQQFSQEAKQENKRQAHKRSIKNAVSAQESSTKTPNDPKWNDYRLPKAIWDKLSRKQRALYLGALKAKGLNSKEFVEKPRYSEPTVPRHQYKLNTAEGNAENHDVKNTNEDSDQDASTVKQTDIWRAIRQHKRMVRNMRRSAPTKPVRTMADEPAVLESEGNRDSLSAPIPRKPKPVKVVATPPKTKLTSIPMSPINTSKPIDDILGKKKVPGYWPDPALKADQPKIEIPIASGDTKKRAITVPPKEQRPKKLVKLVGLYYLYDVVSHTKSLIWKVKTSTIYRGRHQISLSHLPHEGIQKSHQREINAFIKEHPEEARFVPELKDRYQDYLNRHQDTKKPPSTTTHHHTLKPLMQCSNLDDTTTEPFKPDEYLFIDSGADGSSLGGGESGSLIVSLIGV